MDVENPIETTRPDFLTAHEIQRLFSPFGDAYDAILRREHTIIFGPRDSGKSMVLKYMSLPTQLVEHKSLSNLPFIGIYLPLSASICSPFVEAYRSDKDKHWEMFSHCFNLLFSEMLLGTVGDIKSIDNNLRKEIVESVKNAFGFLRNIDDPIKIVGGLLDERRKISDKIELRRSLSPDGFNEVTFIHSFIPFICQRLNEIFSRAIGKEMKTYLLIDGYENLEELAPVFNVLIERYGGQPYFLKIGARRFGEMAKSDIRSRNIEPYQDFNVVSLIYENPASQSYVNWVRSIINESHFKGSKDQEVKTLDIFSLLSPGRAEQISLPSIEYGQLELPSFSQKSREARQRNYYGFLTFVLLSSGIVGDFIKLCHAVMNRRLEEGDEFNRKSLAGTAKNFSEDQFSHILERGGEYGIKLQRLVYHLLSNFEKEFIASSRIDSNEAIPYKVKILPDNTENESNHEFFSVLKQGLEIGILQSEKATESELNNRVPLEFWVNLALMPKFGLKPTIGEEV